MLPGPIVSTDWLADRLGSPRLRVVDGSWYLPAMARDPRQEFRAGHIPGAVFYDLDALADQTSVLPHMLPDPELAARDIGRLGIGNDDVVIAYDGSGTNLSAPRIWWTLRVLGHDRVAVLDGGIGKWVREGKPVERGDPEPRPASFRPAFRSDLIRSLSQVEALVGTEEVTLLDARAAGRFEGREPEPRPGLRSGHIPGAKNLPYAALVAADGTLLEARELRERFRDAGVDLNKPVVTSCGSGVSACALALGLEVLGHRRYAVYDGSWTEWGGRADTPVETGPA
jgi:thiosulfate/3-mercaptopyruvate sulfurtransferase